MNYTSIHLDQSPPKALYRKKNNVISMIHKVAEKEIARLSLKESVIIFIELVESDPTFNLLLSGNEDIDMAFEEMKERAG